MAFWTFRFSNLPRSFSLVRYLIVTAFAGILSLQCTPRAAAQASVQGQWQTLPTLMPINPVHTALLHNGKVLIVSGSGNLPTNTNLQAAVFDPATGAVTTQPAPAILIPPHIHGLALWPPRSTVALAPTALPSCFPSLPPIATSLSS